MSQWWFERRFTPPEWAPRTHYVGCREGTKRVRAVRENGGRQGGERRNRGMTRKTAGQAWPPPRARLELLIEEATIDAHDDSEQRVGFFTMIDENLVLPFATDVLGVTVTVHHVDLTTRRRSSLSAGGAAKSRRSGSSTSRCPNRRRAAPSGSRRTAVGFAAREGMAHG